MIDWDEVERRLNTILGDGYDENRSYSLLFDKVLEDPSSWVSIYDFFFDDYEQHRDDRFFDEVEGGFFRDPDGSGLESYIARVMLRDGLAPRDLPELCAAVGRTFERFHQKFFVEAEAVRSGDPGVVLDPDLYSGWEYKDFEEPLEFQVRMVFLLQLWQNLPQVFLWRKRYGKLFYWVMDDLKRHCSDFAALAPWGYHYYQDDYDIRFNERYELVNRIRLDTNLRITELHMNDYSVGDLSPLSSLSELRKVYLYDKNCIVDLTPFSSLSKLASLFVINDEYTDKSFLRSQPNIGNLLPLTSSFGLTHLRVVRFCVSDLSPLSQLSLLDYLSLFDNEITDVSPLSSLSNLQVLNLGYNSISNLSPLSSLTKLTELILNRNNIADFSPLSSLTNLEKLSLNDNEITDLRPLASLSNLRVLKLNDNPIVDLTPLRQLANLRELSLSGTLVSDLSLLASLTNLEGLWLNDNKCSSFDVSPLVSLEKLTILALPFKVELHCRRELEDSIVCPALLKVKDEIKYI